MMSRYYVEKKKKNISKPAAILLQRAEENDLVLAIEGLLTSSAAG